LGSRSDIKSSTSSSVKDLRKSLKILREQEASGEKIIREAVFIEDGPLDVDPATVGPETRVEVSFKDGDDVEVEVYAQGNEELKRLMDLAGIFHKDKQSGIISPPVPDMAPDAMSVEPAPTMDLGAPDAMAPDMGPDTVAPDAMAPELDPGAMMAPTDNEPIGSPAEVQLSSERRLCLLNLWYWRSKPHSLWPVYYLAFRL